MFSNDVIWEQLLYRAQWNKGFMGIGYDLPEAHFMEPFSAWIAHATW